MNKDTKFSSDKTMCFGKKLFSLSKPMVMGILNCTTDSFYDGGQYTSEEAIVRRAFEIIEQGGDVIDIGAVSSKPGAELIPTDVEIERLVPIIKLLRHEFPNAILSVDTCWAKVAKAVADEGADIINDISGGQFDKEMPSVMQTQTQYADIMQEMIMYFSEKLDNLYYLGVKDIIIDPGFGFAKTLEQNYTIMKHLKDFSVFKEPLLVGISRKSMIYNLLNSDAQKALNGTTVLNTYALMNGAKFIRVHDVKEAVETIKIIEQLNKH